jgi:hypothetical protein
MKRLSEIIEDWFISKLKILNYLFLINCEYKTNEKTHFSSLENAFE